MLTEEQIKKLKPGDELTHTVYFKSIDDKGYIHCDFNPRYSRFEKTFAVDPGVLTLPEENTIVFFPSSIFKNITPNEKQQLTSFFHSYYLDKRKKNELRFLLKKTGIDIMNATPSPDRTFCHTVDNMVKPKYDPNRPFKKGDKVRIVEWNGRKDCREGMEATVLSNERGCFVDIVCMIKELKAELTYPACHLELVTPVEELEPYSVHEESMHNQWNVIKDKYVHGIHAMFPYKNIGNSDLMSREEAKARADEYSARLNAEWRKEQNNG